MIEDTRSLAFSALDDSDPEKRPESRQGTKETYDKSLPDVEGRK